MTLLEWARQEVVENDGTGDPEYMEKCAHFRQVVKLAEVAPEMLAALRLARQCEGLQNWGGGDSYEMKAIDAAIAKGEAVQ